MIARFRPLCDSNLFSFILFPLSPPPLVSLSSYCISQTNSKSPTTISTKTLIMAENESTSIYKQQFSFQSIIQNHNQTHKK